jgi:biotin carboxyl carrier protein
MPLGGKIGCHDFPCVSMTLNVRIDGAATRLEVNREGEQYRFRLDDQAERRAEIRPLRPGVYSVLLDGRSYDVYAQSDKNGAWITVGGRRFHVAIADPRRWIPGGSGPHGHELENIVAPMPGKIVRVLVEPGQAVEAGQGVVVIEAMKMQNEMKARRAGRVTAVPVSRGETVAAGAILATIEPAGE